MITFLEEIGFSRAGILPPLVNDYIGGREAISSLAKYPFQFASFKNVITDKSKDNTERKLLVDVLKSQYAGIPVTQHVADNIQSLLSDNTFTVTAAHQPCLFMGPLYNIYKIACTINICNQLKSQFPENNFVPVFWLGSEDHDVEELNHAFVNGKKLEWQDSGRGAAGRWKTASMKKAVDELKSAVDDSIVVSILEEGLKKYETFGRFTQYFVNEIFKEYGLVVLDQDDARLKKRFSEVINDEVLNSRAAHLLNGHIEALEKNYKVQAKPRDINFFYLGENFRERVVFNASTNMYEVMNTSLSFPRHEITAEIETRTECFSPNVILRPLYQEMILPNLAFVGGAGELNYWLELKPMFDYYEVNYPMLVLRNSAVIINSSLHKKITKLNLKPEDFFGDVELLINNYVKNIIPSGLDLSVEKKRLEELYSAVTVKAEKADSTLKQSVLAEQQKALNALENLEGKMLKAEKRRNETAVNQMRGIHSAFFPDNILQERRENFIPFYSKEFISEMIEVMDGFSKSLKVFVND